MALSDCPKCWDTPCCCGYKWRKYYNLDSLKKHRDMIDKIIKEKEVDISSKEGL